MPAMPELDSTLFGPPLKIISREAIFDLDREQQRQFLEYFNNPGQAKNYPAERIGSYINERSVFTYVNDTYTAQQTLDEFKGNCLSLAIVISALAKLVELDIKYQLIATVPTYEKLSDVIFVVEHVRCKFRNRAKDYPGIPADRDSTTTIDYYNYRKSWPGKSVSEDGFVAMYYRNMASEAMAQRKLAETYWLLKKSLELAPDNGHTLNMLAIVFRRKGELETAEQLYQYGLSVAEDKLHLLKNYRALLKQQRRFVDVERINKQLDKLYDPNPYNWIVLAQEAVDEQDYHQAIRHYQKAIDLAFYLHDAYLGLANAHLLNGNRRAARETLRALLEQTYSEEKQKLYSAKLKSI